MQELKHSCLMPDSFDERYSLLNSILQKSLETLLKEARTRDILSPPYGRPETPTPFVDENNLSALALDESDDDYLEFKYEYGFNPLTFLGNLILKSHPSSLAAVRNNILQAHNHLKKRVAHANIQLNTALDLQRILSELRSGILHGPITSPLSANSVLCTCRAVAEGEVVCQVSKRVDFSEIAGTFRAVVLDASSAVKITVTDLEPNTRYFLRVCLQDEGYDEHSSQPSSAAPTGRAKSIGGGLPHQHHSFQAGKPLPLGRQTSSTLAGRQNSFLRSNSKKNLFMQTAPLPSSAHGGEEHGGVVDSEKRSNARFRGVEDMAFRHSTFVTLSSAEDNVPFSLVAFTWAGLLSEGTSAAAGSQRKSLLYEEDGKGGDVAAAEPLVLSCLLGDLPTASGGPPSRHAEVAGSLRSALWRAHHSHALRSEHSLLRRTSLLLGWDDRSSGADTSLKAEEVLYRQYLSEQRKYERLLKKTAKKSTSKHTSIAPPLKPPPTLQRPPIAPSVQLAVQVRTQAVAPYIAYII